MKKGIIIAIVAGLLAVIIIVVGVLFGIQMMNKNKGGEDTEDISNKEVFKHEVGEMYSNLSDSKKIVKVNSTVETTDEKFLETLTNKNYIIRNEINEIIRNKKLEDIEVNNGQQNLQKQIVTRLNEVFNTKLISDIYFNDFIVQ